MEKIKPLIMLIAMLAFLASCSGEKPYNESADAKAEIRQALAEVKQTHLPLVIIFGANWCPECRALSDAIKTGKNAAKIAKEFKIVKVDVGNFDHNLDVASSYGNPIASGIPGAAFLNANNAVLYVTKPGELSTARESGENDIYEYLKKVTSSLKS
jgi:thioredoxin 1